MYCVECGKRDGLHPWVVLGLVMSCAGLIGFFVGLVVQASFGG